MDVIEQTRDFFDRQPCNVRHGKAEPGSLLWSDQVTVRKYFVEPHIVPFAEFWKWKDKRVLEIGCGIGTDTLQFMNARVKHIDAIDISKESLILAIKRLHGQPSPPIVVFYEGNAEDPLPFAANTWNNYDLVYSWGVLHHTPHPEAVLQNACKYLKPDGELRIMLYAKWSWKHLFTRQQPEAQAGCPLVRWYSMTGAKRLVESCGFRVTSIRKTHIFPWRVPDYVEYRYVKAFPWNVAPHKWFEPLLGHHLLITARRSPKTPENTTASVGTTPLQATGTST